MDQETVNSYITKAFSTRDLVSQTLSSTIGHVMENAVVAQKGTQQVEHASVAKCCTMIISLGAAPVQK